MMCRNLHLLLLLPLQFGNLCTAVVTGLLLMIANLPATDLSFGFFVFVMYAGFPFTVLSQLTTGPMLDVIAPEDKIGYVQVCVCFIWYLYTCVHDTHQILDSKCMTQTCIMKGLKQQLNELWNGSGSLGLW